MGYIRQVKVDAIEEECKGSSDYDDVGGRSHDEGGAVADELASGDGCPPGVDDRQPGVPDESEACQTPVQSTESGTKVRTSPF